MLSSRDSGGRSVGCRDAGEAADATTWAGKGTSTEEATARGAPAPSPCSSRIFSRTAERAFPSLPLAWPDPDGPPRRAKKARMGDGVQAAAQPGRCGRQSIRAQVEGKRSSPEGAETVERAASHAVERNEQTGVRPCRWDAGRGETRGMSLERGRRPLVDCERSQSRRVSTSA